MISAYRSLLCLLVGACVCAAGCAEVDPFEVETGIPVESASRHWAPPAYPPPPEPVRAVPDLKKGPLSLADCILIAMANNPRTRVSWQSTQAAAALVGQARALYLPQADFTYSAQRQKFLSQTDVGFENVYFRTREAASFGVRQLLLDGGLRRAQVEAAEAGLRSADFRHNSLLLDLALATEISYYRLLATQSLLEVAENTVQQRTKHLEMAQRQQEAGRGRQVEVLQAASEKADAELALVDGRNQVRIMCGRLASVMGLPVSAPIEIVEVPDEAHEVEKQDVERLLQQAALNRPTLQSAISEVERARHALEAQKAQRWPELNAAVSYGWAGWQTVVPEASDEYSASLTLSVPLFTGFQRSYRIRQAEAELKGAIASYESELRDVELDVWEAYSGLVRAEEALKAAETFLESSRETVSVTEREYEQGRATIVELIDAQNNLTRALSRKVTVRLDWYVALGQLERAVGKSWLDSPRDERRGN